jgi:hypothetical protein
VGTQDLRPAGHDPAVRSPRGLPLTAADARTITDLIGGIFGIFPVVPRAEGLIFDFFVSSPDVNN